MSLAYLHTSLSPALAFWILFGLQGLGLCSAWMTRLCASGRGHRRCQWLFFLLLSLVGLATAVARAIHAAGWLMSAVTLALMILAAVWDFGRTSRTEVA